MKSLLIIPAFFVSIVISSAATLPNYHWGVDIGTTAINELDATAFDNNGNVFATGNFVTTIDVQPGSGTHALTSTGGTDMFLVKYNSAGSVLWGFNLVGTASVSSHEGGYGVSADNAGNVYVVGYFMNTVDFDPGVGTSSLTANLSAYDGYVAKYDGNGNYLWAFRIGGAPFTTIRDIQVDANGDIVVTGNFSGTTDFDPGSGMFNLTASGSNEDIFVAKYTAAGNFVWAFSIGGADPDYPRCVDTDASGNICITGSYRQSIDFNPGAGVNTVAGTSDDNLFLASYDASGNYRWAFGFGSLQNDAGYGVAVDNIGNVIVTGYIGGNVDIDPGNGVTNVNGPSANSRSLLLAKYSNSGQLIWGFALGGTTIYGSSGRSVDTDQSGNIYITGTDGDEMDFDPGAGVFTIPSYAASKSFLAGYSASGSFLWAFGQVTTTPASSNGFTVQVDPNSTGIVFGGTFSGPYDLNPDSTVNNTITGLGKNNGFLGYYTLTGVIESVADQPEAAFSCWPNPATDLLNISVSEHNSTSYCVELFTIDGSLLQQEFFTRSVSQLDLSPYPSGVYLVRISSADFVCTRKIMVE